MCCACTNSNRTNLTGGEYRKVEVDECIDTNFNGETDSYEDGCRAYNGNENWCGNYDDNDFVSAEMCCACNGGSDGNELEMKKDPYIPSWVTSLETDDKYVWDRLVAD